MKQVDRSRSQSLADEQMHGVASYAPHESDNQYGVASYAPHESDNQ